MPFYATLDCEIKKLSWFDPQPVRDTGPNVIANSMQLIAGRTGQQYNQRKGRHGAFWEDRYAGSGSEAQRSFSVFSF